MCEEVNILDNPVIEFINPEIPAVYLLRHGHIDTGGIKSGSSGCMIYLSGKYSAVGCSAAGKLRTLLYGIDICRSEWPRRLMRSVWVIGTA